MRIIHTKDSAFKEVLQSITSRGDVDTKEIEKDVRNILEDVRRRGDTALFEYTERFDGVDIRDGMVVERREMESALDAIPRRDRRVVELAIKRIEDFHRRSVPESWFLTEEKGTILGQKVTPIERAGVYVPGGKAVYPSTVIMNVVPAKVAGVDEVVMVTPPRRKGINPYVLATAFLTGVDRIYRVGGVQAIGALAYGTETIPKVDKIVGPGNIYVATAKRLVFGTVDIDMVAGPSEILIVNDGTGRPEWIAMDLLSQAEHDELASSILITTSRSMAEKVKREVEKALRGLKRKTIARASTERYGVIIVAGDIREAIRITNRIAPEHLELFVERPFDILGYVRNAGCIFLGRYTPEPVGDYLAGPNHVLPTGGTARFSSPLGVEDFLKRSSIISFSRDALNELKKPIERLATIEGLTAHRESVRIREE